jgi:multidrug efflux system membrane fusion protein
LPDIVPQLSAGTTLLVTAFDRANVKQLAAGQVSALDNQIDTTTGTVKVRAQFDNSDNVLFPNQFVNAQLLVTTLHNTVTVPTAAIQRGLPGNTPGDPPGAYVYLINSENVVSVQPVTVGTTDGLMAAVKSGLNAGDRVVVEGADRLRGGSRVTISKLDGKTTVPTSEPGAAGPRGEGAPNQTPGGTQNRRNNRAQ